MSIEVMQQALKILENGAIARPGWVPDYDDAITSLRAALAASRVVPPEAVEDADAYDDGVMLARIDGLHRRLAEQLAPQEPLHEQDIEDAIEAAYWHFDARKKGLNEWASAPQSERDAFKAEARKLAKGYFPTQQGLEEKA